MYVKDGLDVCFRYMCVVVITCHQHQTEHQPDQIEHQHQIEHQPDQTEHIDMCIVLGPF